MIETSSNLGLPFLQPSQALKHVTHNEALARLDVLVQLTIAGLGVSLPPADPMSGECYVVGAGAVGAWAGHEVEIAVFREGFWEFVPPAPGWVALVRGENTFVWFDGADWVRVGAEVARTFGVNAQADLVNRLSVSAPATLLSHEGGGHQLVVNKAGSDETASLLFQSDWVGRAEVGLVGEGAFSIKVSPDGAGWQTAMRFDPSSGAVSGVAVQQSASDALPGRLMLAEHGVLRSQILGSVAQSGGQPTGAILEHGETAHGRYVKWADGTMICFRTVQVDLNSDAPQVFTYPASMSTLLAAQACGADGAEAADGLKRKALGELPIWLDASGWHVQLEAPVSPATLDVRLMAFGLWV